MNARRLQQPGGLEAGLAGFADHYVVVHGDAELFSRRHDLAGHFDVGLRGRRVARGVIVDGDERGGGTNVRFGLKPMKNAQAQLDYYQEVRKVIADLNMRFIRARLPKLWPKEADEA
jgi:hypothetical protein